tara:strand:+ start:1418 stop:3490 length:2073 start_codon:yes stop_codon:yes gene_type:complete
MSRTRDIARILGKTEGENPSNTSLLSGTASLTVFDTLDSLPITGLTSGDQAFVNATSRLYITNGIGWYNVALVNRNPRWDSGGEPNAEYSIVDSATPLTITARAADSDNLNLLNQSVATDSAQHMVTISNDSSVWTFTPKTADSIGAAVLAGDLTDSNGDFVYTFKWSDGVNFVSKDVTITYNPAGGGGGGTGTADGFWSVTRNYNPSDYNSTPIWPQMTSVHQAPDGKYYMTGYHNYNSEGGFLHQFDENGDLQWSKKWGNNYNRTRTLVFDGNNPIVIGDDAGYGYNDPGGNPKLGSLQKFDTSGNRTWSKIFKPNTISSNAYGTDYFFYGAKDTYGNFWSTFVYNKGQTSPANYTEDVNGLMKYDASGVFQGCFLLPPSSSNPRLIPQNIYIDKAGTSLYLAFTSYDPSATSYPHGNVSKFSISSGGVPTYVWTKSYGQFEGAAHYDVPQKIYESSDGNIIVGGYTQQSNVSSQYFPTLMKLDASDGSWIWKKRYDGTYGEYHGGVSMITNDDKIYMFSTLYNSGNSQYEFYLRQIDASDGSHLDMWEFDFTGQANPSVDNASYSWSQWRLSENVQGVNLNKDGNIIIGMIPNGNGFDYRPSFLKLPNPVITGTFGGGTGTYSGNIIISDKNVTPTDYTYNATDMTYASFSTINSQGGQYSMVNYNSGTWNNTLSSFTVVDEQGTIT